MKVGDRPGGNHNMFPDEFAHAVGPGNSFDKLATSTEGADRDCAVIEKAAGGGFSGISTTQV